MGSFLLQQYAKSAVITPALVMARYDLIAVLYHSTQDVTNTLVISVNWVITYNLFLQF